MIFKKKDNLDIEVINLDNKYAPKEEKSKKPRNREFVIVTYVILCLLISLCGYYCYYLSIKSETFINSSYNKRLNNLSAHVIRGDIITSDDVVIATTKTSNGYETRLYPEGSRYAHVTGFASNGMSGIEKDSNFNLLRSHSFILKRLKNEVLNEKNRGDTIVTTIDSKVQNVAYDKLSGNRGAVIALDPKTGEIICMVSKPDYDPNSIEGNWEQISTDSDNSPLLNRATQGLYPPGSTFKIVTALEYLKENGSLDDRFNCTGSFSEGDMKIRCYHETVHGDESFLQAFSHSCNSAFAEIGLTLNKKSYIKLTDAFLFNKRLPTNLSNVAKSNFSLTSSSGTGITMQTSIGQGDTLVTPIHMAMIAASIENNGVLVKPRLVKEIVNDTGEHVKSIKADTYGSIISEKDASLLRECMRSVVTEGTASSINTDRYTIYGKTGTAEYSSDKNKAHSWFVGFAEQGDRQLAIAVIMEGAGSGSSFATPLAKEVFDAYFNNP